MFALRVARRDDRGRRIVGRGNPGVRCGADGDARGGAALSIREITGKPIKFLGVGEKTAALEPFHPDRVASRILGMGDVLSLVEEVEQKVDRAKAEKLATKLRKGKGFDLADFKEQLEQMIVDDLPSEWRLACQFIPRDEDIVVEYEAQ